MLTGSLEEAVREAERFLRLVEKLPPPIGNRKYVEGGKEAAAVRRASLDLTRALAVLRSREQS